MVQLKKVIALLSLYGKKAWQFVQTNSKRLWWAVLRTKNKAIWAMGIMAFLLFLNLFLTLFLWFTPATQSQQVIGTNNNKTQITSNEGIIGGTTYQVSHYDIPEKVDFAGEAVPLHDPQVFERLDRELISAVYLHSGTLLSYKRASRWFPQMEEIFKKYNVPEDFKYLVIVESHLSNAISISFATGYWQFMENTAREYGLEVNQEIDERYHPLKATEAAAKYFLQAYQKFKNWTCVAASYNMGMNGLEKQLQWQKSATFYDTDLNDETTRYIYKILAYKLLFGNPEKYGYAIPDRGRYKPIKFKEIVVNSPIPDLVAFAKAQGVTYKILKDYNPWIMSDKLTMLTPNKNYILLIPELYFNTQQSAAVKTSY